LEPSKPIFLYFSSPGALGSADDEQPEQTYSDDSFWADSFAQFFAGGNPVEQLVFLG
jgi:hypothetical protein